MNRREFIVGSASVAALAGVPFYTWRIEPHWFEVVDRIMPIVGLPRELRNKKLIQLSDLHIGPRVDDDFLLSTFSAVASLAPDIVVITGDFISYETDYLKRIERILPHIPHGSRGTFAVLGNHDYGPDWNHPEVAKVVTSVAQSAGIQVLRNDVAEVNGLHIVGMDDMWSGHLDIPSALSLLPKDSSAIALSHNPDTADLPVWDGFSGWVLSGHTHGGQCKPPFLPPPILPVQNKQYSAGEYQLNKGRRMYINRGLGHLIRVRFNVRPEVTRFTLIEA